MKQQSYEKPTPGILSRLFLPYREPLLQQDFSRVLGGLLIRKAVSGLALALFALWLGERWNEPLSTVWVQTPLLALFWLPFITATCRRLQGAGVSVPYLGWFFLAVAAVLFLVLGDDRDSVFAPFEFWDMVLFFAVILCVWLWKDNPKYGVGVFSREGIA